MCCDLVSSRRLHLARGAAVARQRGEVRARVRLVVARRRALRAALQRHALLRRVARGHVRQDHGLQELAQVPAGDGDLARGPQPHSGSARLGSARACVSVCPPSPFLPLHSIPLVFPSSACLAYCSSYLYTTVQ